MSRRGHLGGFRGVVGAALAFTLLLGGCQWRTDMWFQASHRPEDSPRVEPSESVPLGEAIHLKNRDDAEGLKNPTPGDTLSIRHGRALFAQRCACCHGAAGHGGGPVSKFFPPAPDLAFQTVKAHSDGYLYGTITFGGRAMPPQAEGLTQQDRWDLVNAIRSIQSGPAASPEPGSAGSAAAGSEGGATTGSAGTATTGSAGGAK